jgi:hypothetical protein
MKTKNLHRILFATSLTGLLFAACSKSNNSNNSNATTTSDSTLQTQSDDEARVSNETDAAFNDVNTSMSASGDVSGASQSPVVRFGVGVTGASADTVQTTICDAIVVIDSVSNPRTITITYNGTNCNLLRVRTGTITISIPQGVQWRDQGAQVTVTFANFMVTRLLDNKTITFNGTHTYTNVSGGSLASLNANSTTTITHTLTSSNMSITFDNGTQRTWNIARQRVFSYNSGIVVTETGLETQGTLSGISEWGLNRYGNSFTAQLAQALVVSQSCSWQTTSGEAILTNSAGSIALTFGLNSTGQATSCPIFPAVFYYQLVWTGAAGKTYSYILPY